MRLGLLGDIHGNALALTAVLDKARDSGVDALCITGDFVGYYYEPDEVLEMLEEWTVYSVRGNHEDLFLECSSNSGAAKEYRRCYGSGIDYALRLLSSQQKEFIKGLPRTLVVEFATKSVLIAHGAPWDTDFYMYPNSDPTLWEKVVESRADYVVLGHTHYRDSKIIGDSLVINPGSVGQPRDRKPGASWVILDTSSGWFEHRTEKYEIARVVEKAKSIDPDKPYLWNVLTRR